MREEALHNPGYPPGSSVLENPVAYESRAISFSPNPDYDRYLRMHKVFVGKVGAGQLEEIYDSLSREQLPRYVGAAGWAAAEAAIIQTELPTKRRLELLEQGIACWQRALQQQTAFNRTGIEHLMEYGSPYRYALDLACAPLLAGVIAGDVTDKTSKDVFADYLSIANANAAQIKEHAHAGNTSALGDHIGIGYECNALLALNRLGSNTWFAIPAMARSDSGHHHRGQTHDLLVLRQKWGHIKSIIPVEVKAKPSLRDRNRYQALLVRGKMHLSVEGKYKPEETLAAINAVHEGTASIRESEIAQEVSQRFLSMLKDYYAGERLGSIATDKSVTRFHDKSLVIARHPGLSPTAA